MPRCLHCGMAPSPPRGRGWKALRWTSFVLPFLISATVVVWFLPRQAASGRKFDPDGVEVIEEPPNARRRMQDSPPPRPDVPILAPARLVDLSDVAKLAFSPDGKLLVTAQCIPVDRFKFDERTVAFACLALLPSSPDGKLLATAHCIALARLPRKRQEQTALQVWDLETGKQRFRFAEGNEEIAGLAISPDGRRLACCTRHTMTLTVRDLQTGKLLRGFRHRCLFQENLLAFSPDGRHVLAGVGPSVVKIDVKDGLMHYFHEGVDNSTFLACLPMTPLLLAAAKDLKVLDLNGVVQKTIPLPGPVLALAVARDGKTIALTFTDRHTELWDISTWKPRLRLRPAPGKDVEYPLHLDLSADARVVAVTLPLRGHRFSDVAVWHLDAGGVSVQRHEGFDALALSPDGKTLALALHAMRVKFVDPLKGERKAP